MRRIFEFEFVSRVNIAGPVIHECLLLLHCTEFKTYTSLLTVPVASAIYDNLAEPVLFDVLSPLALAYLSSQSSRSKMFPHKFCVNPFLASELFDAPRGYVSTLHTQPHRRRSSIKAFKPT